MRHELHFNFDGRWSYDMGVVKVNIGGGLLEDQIISSKTILEEKIEGRKKPYFYGVQREPLSFPLPIFFDNNLSNEKIREILRWLDCDDYRPFYMIDSPERVVYAMVVDDVNAIHNGIKSGYMELTMRTDSPYVLTPYTKSRRYRFMDNTEGRIVEFENNGDFNCKPIVYILKHGDGDIKIQNLSNYTGDFVFTDLNDNEEIMVDCEHKEIESSLDIYRYDNFSKKYLEFVRGINRLKVIGDCELWFETAFEMY